MELSVAAIRVGFSKLPRELYDNIECFVFTAPSSPIDLTDRSNPFIHTSLKLLSISRATRIMYAASYYSREFIFSARLFMWSINPVIAWALSIPRAHRAFLTKITLIRLNNQHRSSNEYLAGIIGICKADIEAALEADVATKVIYQLSDCR